MQRNGGNPRSMGSRCRRLSPSPTFPASGSIRTPRPPAEAQTGPAVTQEVRPFGHAKVTPAIRRSSRTKPKAADQRFPESGRRESNSRSQLGKSIEADAVTWVNR